MSKSSSSNQARRTMRIAVVSPFLDRRHGTERCTVNQVERLAKDGCEIHLYCQRVDDLRGVEPWQGGVSSPAAGRIFWHRVRSGRGPHLVQFLWWMVANRWRRWRDSRSPQLHYDLVYSPGINCNDADAVMVHVVFHELVPLLEESVFSGRSSVSAWARRMHRRLYYRLLKTLEKRVYTRPELPLATVSHRAAADMARHFGRTDVPVIPYGIDLAVFDFSARRARRSSARQKFGYAENDCVVLLIGNDWKNKGLPALMEAVASGNGLRLKVLVVGQDDRRPFLEMAQRLGVASSVRFEGPSRDVMQFYAAADVYVSPSLLDSFALPVAEAMACGLPAVTSSEAGVSAFVEDGVDCFVLRDPRDASALARILRRLCEDAGLRRNVGEKAARSAQKFSWDKNASSTLEFLETALRKKEMRGRR